MRNRVREAAILFRIQNRRTPYIMQSAVMSEAVIGLLPGLVADIGGTCVLGLDGSASGPFPLSWPPVRAFACDVFA